MAMRNDFFITAMPSARTGYAGHAFLSAAACGSVLEYHRSFPQYCATPLCRLDGLAARLGVSRLYVKDESARFGLNAFKVLGASYAMGRLAAQRLGISPDAMRFDTLTSPAVRARLGGLTFVAATDGNHGRGVAWTAGQMGCGAVIYMPKGTAQERVDNILALGAQVQVLDLNYDGCVRLARDHARERGWMIIQDTAWPGYEDIPRHIMQGYATMVLEALAQLGDERPTHVLLQAGVGSLAAAVSGLIAGGSRAEEPLIVTVEPNKADCIFRTAQADDNRLHAVTGSMDTIMAGLACGEVNPIAWDVLTATASWAASCPEWTAAEGMRMLASGTDGDDVIVSGESGAAPVGFLSAVMRLPRLSGIRNRLGLGKDSRVLCFSTEGATDQKNYDDIVQGGAYPSEK